MNFYGYMDKLGNLTFKLSIINIHWRKIFPVLFWKKINCLKWKNRWIGCFKFLDKSWTTNNKYKVHAWLNVVKNKTVIYRL
jgi:hypothetical protein